MAGGRPGFVERALDLDPLHRQPGAGPVVDGAVVLPGVAHAVGDRFEGIVEGFEAVEEFDDGRFLRRHIEVARQVRFRGIGQEVADVDRHGGRFAAGLVPVGGNADAVLAELAAPQFADGVGGVAGVLQKDGVLGLADEAAPLDGIAQVLHVAVDELARLRRRRFAVHDGGIESGVGRGQVLLDQHRGKGQGGIDVVEALAGSVLRQQRRQVDLDAQQVLQRVVVFDPVEPANDGPALAAAAFGLGRRHPRVEPAQHRGGRILPGTRPVPGRHLPAAQPFGHVGPQVGGGLDGLEVVQPQLAALLLRSVAGGAVRGEEGAHGLVEDLVGAEVPCGEDKGQEQDQG